MKTIATLFLIILCLSVKAQTTPIGKNNFSDFTKAIVCININDHDGSKLAAYKDSCGWHINDAPEALDTVIESYMGADSILSAANKLLALTCTDMSHNIWITPSKEKQYFTALKAYWEATGQLKDRIYALKKLKQKLRNQKPISYIIPFRLVKIKNLNTWKQK